MKLKILIAMIMIPLLFFCVGCNSVEKKYSKEIQKTTISVNMIKIRDLSVEVKAYLEKDLSAEELANQYSPALNELRQILDRTLMESENFIQEHQEYQLLHEKLESSLLQYERIVIEMESATLALKDLDAMIRQIELNFDEIKVIALSGNSTSNEYNVGLNEFLRTNAEALTLLEVSIMQEILNQIPIDTQRVTEHLGDALPVLDALNTLQTYTDIDVVVNQTLLELVKGSIALYRFIIRNAALIEKINQPAYMEELTLLFNEAGSTMEDWLKLIDD